MLTVNGETGHVTLTYSDVDALPDTYVPSWSTITGKPSTYPPSSHTHKWSDITDPPDFFLPGMILIWAGTESQIPTGWQLCDGTGTTSNGITVPNLLDRMVICAGGDYEKDQTGGATSVTTNNTGSHSHSITVNSGGSHSHSVSVNSGGSHDHDFDTNSAGSHSHTVSVSSGGTHSHTVTVNGTTLSEGQMGSHSHLSPGKRRSNSWDINSLYDFGEGYTDLGTLQYGTGVYSSTYPMALAKTDKVGSSQSHTHTASTASNTGSHSHSASTYSTGSHSHSGTTDSVGSHSHSASTGTASNHSHTASSNSTGNHSHTVSTMPPYYALAYIIKL